MCDAWPLSPSNGLLPRLVSCLGRLLDVQLGRGSVLVIQGVEVGGGGCFNDSFQ